MRLNQALVDPVTGTKLSNLRPDVQGFVPPHHVYVFEACVSQTAKQALRKWAPEKERLRKLAYTLHVMAEEG